jgi:magnesium transporter
METKTIDTVFVKHIRALIEQDLLEDLRAEIDNLYPEDVAELLNRMNGEESKQIMICVDAEKAVKVLVEMEGDVRATFLEGYEPKEIANRFIQHMDSDDAAYVLNQIAVSKKEQVIASLTDIEFASNILSLMNYDDYTAGSLMAVELVKANLNWTVQQCIEEIRRQAENVETIYVVYVTDDVERLIGLITLKNLILSAPYALLNEVVNKKVISVSTSTDSETIANLFKKYDLVVLPVVNALGQLVGRITVDDVVEVIKEEANEDYQLMSGITENVDATDKVWILSRARLPWLLIGLLGGISNCMRER